MTQQIILSPAERVPGRAFSDVENSFADLEVMRTMARQLAETYGDPVLCDFKPGKRPVCKSDTHGRYFRIYYIRPQLLFSRVNLTVVGFFGQKRPESNIKPLIAADRRFEATFHEHPGLLSLSTVRQPDGDFGNLVLFTDSAAKDHWNFSPLHHDLAAKISPPYYRSVRINNGWLPGGLQAVNDLFLERTRYLDYAENPPWRAVRPLL